MLKSILSLRLQGPERLGLFGGLGVLNQSSRPPRFCIAYISILLDVDVVQLVLGSTFGCSPGAGEFCTKSSKKTASMETISFASVSLNGV